MKKRFLALLLVLCLAISQLPMLASAADNESTIYSYLTNSMGLNTAAACGVLANLEKESGFNPNAQGDYVDGNPTSYGICQWHNSRWDNLKNYCSQNGYDWTTLNGQLNFLNYELQNSYPGVYNTLRNVANSGDGAYNAGYTWCLKFEVPANTEAVSVSRGNLARDSYWPKYGGSVPATVSVDFSTNSVSDLTETFVTLFSEPHFTNATIANVSSVGIDLYNAAGTWIGGKSEAPASNIKQTLTYIKITYPIGSGKEIDLALAPGTTYQYRFYVVISGQTYVDTMRSFTTAGSQLSITSQPQNVSVKTGETASMSVAASGGNLSYQWQVMKSSTSSWVNSEASGSQTATVQPKTIASNDGYQYRCVVTDGNGNQVISNTATLRVTTIATQPKNVSAKAGDTIKITVKASGPNLNYQWQVKKSGSSSWAASTASGNQTATVQPKAIASNDGSQYRCVITDGNGKTVTSSAMTLRVTAIATQPKNLSVKAGDATDISVKASGPNLSYQWQVKKSSSASWVSSTASGSKTATVKPKSNAGNDGYQYRCVITDGNGKKVTSNAVTFHVTAIKTQPKAASVKTSAYATFTVKATGSGLKYQWQYLKPNGSWTNCTSKTKGYNTATLKVQGVTDSTNRNGWKYRCVITDANGNKITSNAATLSVLAIKTQPTSVLVKGSNTATFTVKATGSNLKYQWQYLKPDGSWTNCTSKTEGYNTATLKVQGKTGSTNRSGYQYRCVITDGAGNKLTSSAAVLSVR